MHEFNQQTQACIQKKMQNMHALTPHTFTHKFTHLHTRSNAQNMLYLCMSAIVSVCTCVGPSLCCLTRSTLVNSMQPRR